MNIKSEQLLENTNTEMRKLMRMLEAIGRDNAIAQSNEWDVGRFKEQFSRLYAMMGSMGRLKLS